MGCSTRHRCVPPGPWRSNESYSSRISDCPGCEESTLVKCSYTLHSRSVAVGESGNEVETFSTVYLLLTLSP